MLNPILMAIFPLLVAEPPPGELDPEDEEDNDEDSKENDNPKHCASQVGAHFYHLHHYLSFLSVVQVLPEKLKYQVKVVSFCCKAAKPDQQKPKK